jgi:uncharacterized protein with HEPN domain
MKSNIVYLKHILDLINKIEEFTKFVKYEEFLKNNLIKNAVILNLEIIGETSKHIPPNIKEKCPGYNWDYFEELGDKLIQYYYEIDLNQVWETVRFRVPELKTQVMNLLYALDE